MCKHSTVSNFYSSPRKIPCLLKSFLNLCNQGKLSEAISSLPHLASKGIKVPNEVLGGLIQQCADTKSLKLCKRVHLHVKLTGLRRPNTFLANNLIKMYCECGDLSTAFKLFDRLSTRNLYSWNYMLSGYAKMGNLKPAIKFFDKMPEKDVVSWNTMLNAYVNSGIYIVALRFYMDLRRSEIGYNAHTFAGLLTICVKLKELELTRQAHAQVFVLGLLSNLVVSSTTLNAYSKCGVMNDARQLFDEMKFRDVLAWTSMISGYAQCGDCDTANFLFNLMPVKSPVSWTALISGYVRHGLRYEALELFTKMINLGIRPDQFTYSSCLCACASIASLNHGKQIHGHLIRTNFRPNTIVLSSLIDMYSKCGSLEVGVQIFRLIGEKQDVLLWNTMISALAHHGHGKEAIQIFDVMIGSGIKPNGITLLVIIHACNHSRLVEEGLKLFESMTCYYGVVPNQEHYASLIDLLGRGKSFDKLNCLLDKMPFEPDERVLNALAGFCNTEVGNEAIDQLDEMQPRLMEKVRRLMDEREIADRAISWIDIENKGHTFTVSDELHPSNDVLHSALDQFSGHMEDELPSHTFRS